MNNSTRNISRFAPIAPVAGSSEAISAVATPTKAGQTNRQKGRCFQFSTLSPPFTPLPPLPTSSADALISKCFVRPDAV